MRRHHRNYCRFYATGTYLYTDRLFELNFLCNANFEEWQGILIYELYDSLFYEKTFTLFVDSPGNYAGEISGSLAELKKPE
jgi:hypothetical protein